MKIFKRISDYLIYLAVCAAIAGIGAMKRPAMRKFADGCGKLLYFLPGFGSLCVKNIHAAFPEMPMEKVKETALKSLQNLVFTLCEFFWIRKHPEQLEQIVDLSECEACARKGLEKAGNGTGTIMITPHLGNWEFAGRILSAVYHYKMATVVKSSRNPYLDRIVSEGRKAGEVKIIYSKGAAQAMKRALCDGYSIGILIDQNTRVRYGGVFVKLFGLSVPVSRAPAVLARSRNRYVAVGTVLHTGDSCRAILRELPKPAGEYQSDEEMIQAITDITEEYIRMAPEQYLWLYKRFQYIPPDTPPEIRKRYPDYAVVPKASFYSLADRK